MPPKRKRKLTDGNKDTNAKKMKTRVPERKSQWTKGKKDLVNPTIVATSVTDSSVNPDVLADAITPQEESQDVTQGTSVSSQGVVERVQEGQIIDTARLTKIKVAKQAEICIKSPDDRYDCHVGGIDVLAGGRLIVADISNRNIKLFDEERHFLSAYTWPWEVAHDVAASRDDVIYVIFSKFVKVMDVKENQFSEKRSFYYHKNYIKGIAVHEGSVFILTATELSDITASQYILKIDTDMGKTIWTVPVKDESYGSPFRNFFEPTDGDSGFYLSSFDHEGKLNVLLSGSRKGKLDAETGAKLVIEDVDFTGPVCYGNGLLYVSDCSNRIFALIPNTNEKVLLIKLQNTPYTVSHKNSTRRRPLPPTFQIKCMKFNPRNNQLLVSYGPMYQTPNNIVCLQLQTEIGPSPSGL